jgi:DnaK suppressor protein
MDARTRGELVNALRRKRAALLKEFLDAEADLRWIAEEREAELEERVQGERAARILSRLDDRSLREMQAIHAALQRMIDGTYGKCPDCGRTIPLARLRAVPAALFCVECAREAEGTGSEAPATAESRHPGRLPPDLEPLLEREVERVLRDLVRQDGRVDMHELRIVCRHGVVHLQGAVPSEAAHQILLRLVTHVAGCEEVADRMQVNEFLRERPHPDRPEPSERERPGEFAPIGTEDIIESTEQGLDYVPPDRPPSEEE